MIYFKRYKIEAQLLKGFSSLIVYGNMDLGNYIISFANEIKG